MAGLVVGLLETDACELVVIAEKKWFRRGASSSFEGALPCAVWRPRLRAGAFVLLLLLIRFWCASGRAVGSILTGWGREPLFRSTACVQERVVC